MSRLPVYTNSYIIQFVYVIVQLFGTLQSVLFEVALCYIILFISRRESFTTKARG